MNESSILLINEAVDGTLDPARRQELDRLLRDDPEAAALHRDLERIAGAVRALPAVEPPAHFSRGVMDRLPARPAPALSRRHGLAEWFRPLFAPRMVLAFATGCLATFIVVGGMDGVSGDEASGTLARPGAVEATLPGGAGRITVTESDRTRIVGIELDRSGTTPPEVVISIAAGDSVLYSGRF